MVELEERGRRVCNEEVGCTWFEHCYRCYWAAAAATGEWGVSCIGGRVGRMGFEVLLLFLVQAT